jgi:coenzyme PQQ biosynthesis protein PqqD
MQTPTIDSSAQPRLARRDRLQTASKTGKRVLLSPLADLELNETAQEIVSRCDGRTVAAIVQALAEEYDADPKTLGIDVRDTLVDLQQRKLIELT